MIETNTTTEMPKTAVCAFEVKQGKTAKQARKSINRFSPLKKGGYSKICKACRCQLSAEWTTARASYRKAYQKARQLVAQGKKVRIPDAKSWKEGDPIRYTNGAIYKDKSEAAASV